jgi:hypothetical protein
LEKKIPFKAHWAKINFIDPAFAARQYEVDQFKPFMRSNFLNPYLVERIDPSLAAKTASQKAVTPLLPFPSPGGHEGIPLGNAPLPEGVPAP